MPGPAKKRPDDGVGLPEYMSPRLPEPQSDVARDYWDSQLVTEDPVDAPAGVPYYDETRMPEPADPEADRYWDAQLAQTAGQDAPRRAPREPPGLMASAVRGAQRIERDASRGVQRFEQDAARGAQRIQGAVTGDQRTASQGLDRVRALAEELGRLKERLGPRRKL